MYSISRPTAIVSLLYTAFISVTAFVGNAIAQERITPLSWQPRLSSPLLDANHDQVADALMPNGASPTDLLDVLVAMNHCPIETDIRRVEQFGDVAYVGRFLSFVHMQNVARSDLVVLARDPAVAMVFPNRRAVPTLDISARAAKIRSSAFYANMALDDVLNPNSENAPSIAIVDSGVDDTQHESLRRQIAGGYDTFTGSETNPDDDLGHGTHVAGIALGTGGTNGNFRGMCPACRLVDIKVLNAARTGTENNVLVGLEKCLQRRVDWNIAVINLSLGLTNPMTNKADPSDGTDPLSQMVNRVVAEGIIVVAAAGNDGPDVRIGSPAAADDAITVSNADDRNTINRADDLIAGTSTRGPRLDDRDALDDEKKPEVAAHGTAIISALKDTTNGYISLDGTSMATPHVAGLAARLVSARPSIRPGSVKRAIITGAEDFGTAGWDPLWGFGLINGRAAFDKMNTPGADIGFTEFCGNTGAWWASRNLTPQNELIEVGVPNAINAQVNNSNSRELLANEASIRLAFYQTGNSVYKFDICERTIPPLARGASTTITCPWTPQFPGHGCLKAEIVYPADPKPQNNCAQHNVDVRFITFGAVYSFEAFASNPTGRRIFVHLSDDFAAAQNWGFSVTADDRDFIMEPFECPRKVRFTFTPRSSTVPEARVNVDFRARFRFNDDNTFSIGGVTVVARAQ